VLYRTADDLAAHRSRYQYGRRGTPTSEALEQALAALEGPLCAGVSLLPSGLAAVSTALLAVVQSGDHILVSDSVYQPTRTFCEKMLKRLGVETTYYDPLIGAGIAKLFKPNTRAVFTEAPGSQSFEMQDIPAIAAAAHQHGARVLMDNTWATPLFFRALDKGVDLSIQAGTKYIGGHSDVMLGTISANAAAWPRGAAAPAPGVRAGGRALAAGATGSAARPASRARGRSGPRHLAARFRRRLGPVQRRAQAGVAGGRACLPGRAHAVRDGLLVGRL
jgi:cystathionine beta-lyase